MLCCYCFSVRRSWINKRNHIAIPWLCAGTFAIWKMESRFYEDNKRSFELAAHSDCSVRDLRRSKFVKICEGEAESFQPNPMPHQTATELQLGNWTEEQLRNIPEPIFETCVCTLMLIFYKYPAVFWTNYQFMESLRSASWGAYDRFTLGACVLWNLCCSCPESLITIKSGNNTTEVRKGVDGNKPTFI